MAASWSEQDDERLRTFMERHGEELSWTELSRGVFPDGRFTQADCVERWKKLSKPKPLRGPWTKDEDHKLSALVAQYGSEKWVVIATEMASRSGKQCRERWHNHLDPFINKGEWTAAEDEIIHSMYAKIGSKWAEMAKHLPGRPDNAIKNYWNASLIRQKRRGHGASSSISSLTGALDISASAQSSPSMSRSTSSTSLVGSMSGPRFTPYVRSSPMTKSRSESVSSPAQMSSPYRQGSTDQYSPPSFSSPYKSPGMTRSQSFCPSFSPSSRQQHPVAMTPLHVVPRDLSKEMVEPSAGYPPYSDDSVRDTPPATPNRSPTMRLHAKSSPPLPFKSSTFPFYQDVPPSPPSSTASSAFFGHGNGQSQAPSPIEHGGWTPQPQQPDQFVESAGFEGLSPFEPVSTAADISDTTSPAQLYNSPFDNVAFQSYTTPGHSPPLAASHSHSYSYDAGSSAPVQDSHSDTHHLQSTFQQDSQSYAYTMDPSLSSGAMPYIHPSHQFGPTSDYLDFSAHTEAEAAPYDWGISSGPLVLDEHQHSGFGLLSAPSPVLPSTHSPYLSSTPTYQAPSYEEIEAATAAKVEKSVQILRESLIENNFGRAKPGLYRNDSSISTSSLTSNSSPAFTSHRSSYDFSSSTDVSPLEASFPPLGPLSPTIDTFQATPMTMSLSNSISRPMRNLNLSNITPKKTQAPESGLAAAFSLADTTPTSLYSSTSSITPTRAPKAPALLRTSSAASGLRLKSQPAQPSFDPFPLARRQRGSLDLRIQTGGASFASPATASPRLMGSLASPSISARHPTSDLMSVDQNGRACLPGMSR